MRIPTTGRLLRLLGAQLQRIPTVSARHRGALGLMGFSTLAVYYNSRPTDCSCNATVKPARGVRVECTESPAWVQGSASASAQCFLHIPNQIQSEPDESFEPASCIYSELKLVPSLSPPSPDTTAAVQANEPTTSSSALPQNILILLPGLLTAEECEWLVRDTERLLCENSTKGGVKTEKWALLSRLGQRSQQILDKMLGKNVLEFIELRLPAVAKQLLGPRPEGSSDASARSVLQEEGGGTSDGPRAMPMSYYWDEPVIIKYLAGNDLAPHEDLRELTIVVPLNPSEKFPLVGGGTRFWPEVGACSDSEVSCETGVSVEAPPGCGIIFNGDMTHSGNPVHQGTRFLLMTSINLDSAE